ncbi:MAG: hypothetical protein N4A49_14720, partial [Marinifilaceae bacterium]|nr:hypothetical protein [Marinifilaceae bacterium]
SKPENQIRHFNCRSFKIKFDAKLLNLTFPSSKAKIDTNIAQRLINTLKSRHTAHQPQMPKA